MTKYRCYCGETVLTTTQVGEPPSCVGCSVCHSTLAKHKDLVKQREPHTLTTIGTEQHCTKCMHIEVNDVPEAEYDMIFLRTEDGEWINNQGEVIAEQLVEKYDIAGRFLRDGSFDKRDDIKSIMVNKNRE